MRQKLKSFYRYHLRGTWQYWNAKRVLKTNQVPILIYSMGKVGSLSIYHSLQQYTKRPVFHLHSLQQAVIDWEYQTCREKGWWPDSKNTGGLVYQHKVEKQQPLQIITPIREPIGRNLSAFFEVFRYYNNIAAIDYKEELITLENRFLEQVPHEYPIQWLEKELKQTLQIDVYATSFDTSKKYQTYQHQNHELLLWRVDLADEIKEKKIQQHIGIADFRLTNHNEGKNKAYAALYEQFKQNIRFSAGYLEQQLNAKYSKHFYSAQERKALYQRWIK